MAPERNTGRPDVFAEIIETVMRLALRFHLFYAKRNIETVLTASGLNLRDLEMESDNLVDPEYIDPSILAQAINSLYSSLIHILDKFYSLFPPVKGVRGYFLSG